jgi:hypothetical protein
MTICDYHCLVYGILVMVNLSGNVLKYKVACWTQAEQSKPVGITSVILCYCNSRVW